MGKILKDGGILTQGRLLKHKHFDQCFASKIICLIADAEYL